MRHKSTNHYNRYDTALICLYALGKEDLVPGHLRRIVPHSTASRWRCLEVGTMIGHELRTVHQEALDYHELLARYQRLRSTVRVITKVWVSVSELVLPVLHRQKEHTGRIVTAVRSLFTIMPRRKAFRLVDISASAFHDRLSRIKLRCARSPLDRCFKRHPLQLAVREVALIKGLFLDPALSCWPAISLYHYAVRSRGLRIGLSSFYKYTATLGLKRRWPKAVHKTIGIRAVAPNQFLHVDTTQRGLADGTKAYIAIVSDNFSKAVLGVSVSLGKHAGNIVAALRKAIGTIQLHHPGEQCAVLVADGGGENHAVRVDELLAAEEHPAITKIIAQRDIVFSNSPIEAINKILKRYLRHHDPRTFAATDRVVAYAVHDYTYVRPHGSLNGLIPMERYINPAACLNFRKEIAEARDLRIEENRKLNCPACTKDPEKGS